MHCQQSGGVRLFLTPHPTVIITFYFDVTCFFDKILIAVKF